MEIIINTTNIKTIKQGDGDFLINNGLIVAPRAGFEISEKCPGAYKLIIAECINNGWLKPIANITQQEYFMEKLSQ